jgi:hypothetical protein
LTKKKADASIVESEKKEDILKIDQEEELINRIGLPFISNL